MIDPEAVDFSHGKDLITQKCMACKGGHHARCSSDPEVMAANRGDVYPYFEDDDAEDWKPDWVCGCFREDREVHPNGDYWDG